MAEIKTRICDVDNARGIKTIAPFEHRVSLDGYEVALDLSEAASAELARVLAPYLEVGRRVRNDHAIVRHWGRINGHEVPKTSRIPDAVYTAYDAADEESRELAAADYKAGQAAKKTPVPAPVAEDNVSHLLDA